MLSLPLVAIIVEPTAVQKLPIIFRMQILLLISKVMSLLYNQSKLIYWQLALTRKELKLQHWLKESTAKKSRSEEHTSELQSLMRISYAVFCLKKKTTNNTKNNTPT